jgi:hypothetical protein
VPAINDLAAESDPEADIIDPEELQLILNPHDPDVAVPRAVLGLYI